MDEAFDSGEVILRLYGLLQALFVCIDSLYTLTFKITGTKNFININDNKALRELKYIRNDVVGHPTNRIVDDKTEYAILNPDDIKKMNLHILFFQMLNIKSMLFLRIYLLLIRKKLLSY